MDLEALSRDELMVEVQGLLEKQRASAERERLVRELELHQVELELQNRELREAHAALDESRSRYADLYDYAPVAYLTLDLHGAIREINLTGTTLLGRPREVAIGLGFVQAVRVHDPQTFWAHLHRCTATRAPVVSELRLETDHQGIVDVQVASAPVFDATGQPIAFRTSFTDITARKQAESALAQSIRAHKDLLAVVSHDLKSPLSALTLGARLVASLLPAGEAEARKGIAIVLRSAERMTGLIEDLLQAAAIEAGTFPIAPRRHAVRELLDELVHACAPIAATRSLALEIHVGEVPLIWCDQARILQVLTNLVGNAMKFGAAGSVITIRASVTGDDVTFAVSDRGPGIADEELAHLFDRYWTGRGYGGHGVGLGLFIAKGIVEAHGGRIWARSTVGEGSEFAFALPIEPVR